MHGDRSAHEDACQPPEDSGLCKMLELDDASLCAVLRCLTATELATVAQARSSLNTAARANLLWLQLIQQDFGLSLTSTADAAPGAAKALYQSLLEGSSRPRALPCRAVCTDGGCDEPHSSKYWADNMFSFTVSDLYCSDAATSNVHVIGRFTPHSSSPGARQDRPLLPAQTPEAQRAFILDRCLQTAKELVSAEHTAATAAVAATEAAAEGAPGRLSLSAAAAAAGGGLSTSSSSQQGAPAGSSVLGSLSSLGRLAWEVATGGGSSSSSRGRERLRMRLLAARAALESCSVRGLCDFFSESYNARQSNFPWAASFFNMSSDADLHKMHTFMFALWAEPVQGHNSQVTLQRWPFKPCCTQPPPPAAAAAAAAGAAAAPTAQQQQQEGAQQPLPTAGQQPGHQANAAVQQQQQQSRELQCDVEQLVCLRDNTLIDSTCLVQEVFIARGRQSTCPIQSGFVFLGCKQQQQQQQQQQVPSGATAAAAADMSTRPAADTAAAAQRQGSSRRAAAAFWQQHAAAAGDAVVPHLNSWVCQPWVSGSSGLGTAAAVLAAAEAGLLPPVLDYAVGPAAEWIEFDRPSQHELQQQQQCADSGSSGSSGSSELSGVVYCPVLWFRFTTAAADAGQHGLEAESDGEDEVLWNDGLPEDGVAQIIHNIVQQWGGPDNVWQQQQQQHGAVADAGGSVTGGPGGSAGAAEHAITDDQAGGSGGSMDINDQEMPGFEADPANVQGPGGLGQGLGQGVHGPGEAAAADAGGLDGGGSSQGGSQPGASGSIGNQVPDGGDPAAAAVDASGVRQPRVVTPWPQCDQCPHLPASSPEVAAALGWYPGQQHPMNLAVKLLQPRMGQLVCVKLIDSEDCNPEFNESRGGCNIDCEMVMCRGQQVTQLPRGMQLLGAACRPA